MEGSKKEKLLKKQIQKIEGKESRLNCRAGPSFLQKKTAPIRQKAEDKIPPKLIDTFEAAFEKAFIAVFQKGTDIIEKSYQKEKAQKQYDILNYALEKDFNKKNLRRIDQSAHRKTLLNKGVATAEGAVLGLLGIGLPDIPLFIGVILKMLYQISLSYGFDYRSEEERIFILYLIAAALSSGEERALLSQKADRIGRQIDKGEIRTLPTLESAVSLASQKLSGSMALSKAVQGFFLIGAVGGAANYRTVSTIGKTAELKYKKRYLAKQ